MDLVIAEKNEAARDIACALCGISGKPADVRLPASGNGYVVTAASGHLLALAEPAEVDGRFGRTEVADLPISIYPWPKRPQGDYQNGKLAAIGEALDACDGTIYHAGDADDEGQLIVDEILEHFGIDPSSPRVMRAYVNDNIPKNIRRAFEQATPNAQHVADGRAAQARALGDFCFGVNESRLASAKLHARLSVGRVQTPTLGLVVARDRQREGHEKRRYFELVARIEHNGRLYDFKYRPPKYALEDGRHCFDESLLEGVAAQVEGRRVDFAVAMGRKGKAAPLPFNLTDLTAEMSRRAKMTANDVMEATQALRDKYKAITYNRAESRHLPEEHLQDAPAVAAIAAENIGWAGPVDPGRMAHGCAHAAFDSAKVGAHHGIIPQETALDLDGMPAREREVYRAVAQRYLCLFAPDAEYDEASAAFEVDGVGGCFEYRERFMRDPGWAACAPDGWLGMSFSDGVLPLQGTGRRVARIARCEVIGKETAPPKAYTDGTLMVAMSNIARYVTDPEVKRVLLEKDADSATEHGSIGTAATRKDIIEALIARGFVERDIAGRLVSTEKGRKFHDLIPEKVKGVDLTAEWWLLQRGVAAGELEEDAVMRSVCEEFLRHRDTAYEGASLREVAGTCPRCGMPVERRGRVWSCASNVAERKPDGAYEDVAGCGFKILPFGGKDISAGQAHALLAGKAVPLKGCISKKSGKKFDCKVALVDGELKPEFERKRAKAQRRVPQAGNAMWRP